MKVIKARDITLVDIGDSKTMVIACDSCGGIGLKTGDTLKVPPYYIGKFTTRVAVMEVICSGAEVVTVVDAVCNEMEPTGKEIMLGINSELEAAGINHASLTGSTEENFPTISTGLGVTAIGIARNMNLKVCSVYQKAVIISVGIPKVGSEIKLEGDSEIVSYEDINYLLKREDVLEIVPVGSKGIKYEALKLSEINNMKLKLETEINIDIEKTAGPATALIAAITAEAVEDIRSSLKNVCAIGELY